VVTQPRLPCYKLGVRFASDVWERFLAAAGAVFIWRSLARRSGAGDEIKVISRDEHAVRCLRLRSSTCEKVWTEELRRCGALCGSMPCRKVGRIFS